MKEVLPEFQGIPAVPTFAFPREPFDKLRSVFQFFWDSSRYPRTPFWKTYEQCVDKILGGAENLHWWPQAELLKGFPDLTMYRFEDLSRIWAEIGFPALRHRNKSTRVVIQNPDYRIDEIRVYYAADFELRKQCLT